MYRYIDQVIVNPHKEVDRTKFPFTLPAFKDFNSLNMDANVILFTGENGSGKSTMLEAMAVHLGLPAEGGSRSHSYSTFDSHSDFWDQILLPRSSYPSETIFLRSESFYNLASYMHTSAKEAGEIPRFGWIHNRSHGQGFLDVFLNLKADGLYLMDEPESALSIRGQLTLLVQMQALVEQNCQLIIATHSPVILGFPGAVIYHFGEEGIRMVSYQETDSYLLTSRYLKDPESFSRLLGIREPSERKSIFD